MMSIAKFAQVRPACAAAVSPLPFSLGLLGHCPGVTLLAPGTFLREVIMERFKGWLVFLLMLLVYGVVGEMECRDLERLQARSVEVVTACR